MKRTLLIVLAGTLVAATLWWFFFRSGDEAQIRDKLDRLAKAVHVEGAENPVVRHARVNSEFVDIFTKEVLVEIPELTTIKGGRAELVGVASQAGSFYSSVDVSMARVEVTFDQTKRNARVGATVTLLGRQGGGAAERDTRDCTFRFDKIDGDWKIASVAVSPRRDP